ncbi:MAG: hypothetical protein WCK53_10055 [Methanomicrobiales archaeon]
MGLLDSIGGGMSGMLKTPEGQEMAKKFLSSPEGQNMITSYIQTPEGKQFFGTLLLGIVDKLNLSPEQKETVRTIAESQLQGVSGR